MNGRTRRFHVVGAGLAGLSAATTLIEHGGQVTVYESALHAGGRCRSYHDAVLDRYIDNGNHLFLSGNEAVNRFLSRIGSAHLVRGGERARFQFRDCLSRQSWQLDAGAGRFPWPLFLSRNRPPGVSLRDLCGFRPVFAASSGTSVESLLSLQGTVYKYLWEPLAIAVLNTPVNIAEAHLLGPVFRSAFRRGVRSGMPKIAARGLSDTFVSPAIDYLNNNGAVLKFNNTLKGMGFSGKNITSLSFAHGDVPLTADDGVVLAVPPWALKGKVPGLEVPDRHYGIINIHFVLPQPIQELTIVGLINGRAQWVFVRDDMASVTISAVDGDSFDLSDCDVRGIWQEVCDALGLGDAARGRYRVIREKRATIAHSRDNLRKRPDVRTQWQNLVLAGDWTDTGLPATIEGAVQSGKVAAETLLGGTGRD